MRTRSLFLLLILGGGGAAQERDLPATTPKAGLQLLYISAYATYYSNGLPATASFQPGPVKLLPDVGAGGIAAVRLSRLRERSSILLTYRASYEGRARYSTWNALNQALSVALSRNLAPRWTAGLIGASDYSSLDQSLFSPTTFNSFVSAPVNFDDLATAVLAGRFNNPQLAPIGAGANPAQAPLRSLIYGERLFTAAAQAYLLYSYSPRLTVNFTAGGGHSQHVSANRAVPRNYLIPNTTSGSGSVSLSYSLSPRTRIGGVVTTSRIVSSLENSYTLAAIGSVGWTFSERWLVQLRGGLGTIRPVGDSRFRSTGPHPLAGGTLGIKTSGHGFLASYDRSVSDAYGLGAVTSSSFVGEWRYRRPGASWWSESSASWQLLAGNTLADTSGWRLTAGLGRSIGGRFSLFTQYAYLNYSGTFQRVGYGLSQHAVRVSAVWNPNPAISR